MVLRSKTYLMVLVDASVNHVSTNTLAIGSVISISRRARLDVGKASEAPRSVLLNVKQLGTDILLDVLDLRKRQSSYRSILKLSLR